MDKKLFCLVGASGTGKSTLLNYVKGHFLVQVTEVSARLYLPKDTDYVNGLTSESQVLITQNRFTSFVECLNNAFPTLFSRSPVDSLAYEHVLKKAPFLNELLTRQIQVTKWMVKYLYLPIEFEMESNDDIVRGTNKDIQLKTDKAIKDILFENEISYTTINGSKEERFKKLDSIFWQYRKKK